MYLKSGLLYLAAAAGLTTVNADFMVYTEPPIPTSAIPSFANPSDVPTPSRPTTSYRTNTHPGRLLDNIRLLQRKHRLQLLHARARRPLPIQLRLRRERNRRLRLHSEQLQRPRGRDGEQDNDDVLRRADVVLCAPEPREAVQGTAGAGSV